MNTFWAKLIVEELVRCGVEYFCISPGSRSTPLVVAAARNDRVRTIICYDERAAAFRNREQFFVNRHTEQARKVILELLEKYRAAGIDQVQPKVFEVLPFREWGGAYKIKDWFGSVDGLRDSLQQMRERIYPESEVTDVAPEYAGNPC